MEFTINELKHISWMFELAEDDRCTLELDDMTDHNILKTKINEYLRINDRVGDFDCNYS